MKKSTLEAIRNYLNGETVDLDTLRQEVNDEYNRLTEKATENAALYGEATPIVLDALDATPKTAAQIYEAVADALPEGFTKNKVQYLLLHQLADRVNKQDNGKNANTYTKKKEE